MIERLESAFPLHAGERFLFQRMQDPLTRKAIDSVPKFQHSSLPQASEQAHTSNDSVAFPNEHVNGGGDDHVHSRAELHQADGPAQSSPVALRFPLDNAPRK